MNLIEASRILTDEYSAKILLATNSEPKSVMELCDGLEIPRAACYKRIHKLEDEGLLACVDRIPMQKGKGIKMYLSQLKSAYILFERGKYRARFELKSGNIDNYYGEWMADSLTKDKLVS